MAGQILDGDSRRIEAEKVSELVLEFCELAFTPECVINDACCVECAGLCKEWQLRRRHRVDKVVSPKLGSTKGV